MTEIAEITQQTRLLLFSPSNILKLTVHRVH